MGALTEEVRQVQNAALGSIMQWQFVVGYSSTSPYESGCPVPLIFVVLPTLLHGETLEYVVSTTKGSGLRTFVAKFSQSRNNDADALLGLHERTDVLRQLSLQSLRVAMRAQLLTVDLRTGYAHELTRTMPKTGISERARALARQAAKFGNWCGDLTLAEVSSLLRVRF